MQGKVKVRTDVSKKSNKREYRCFLNASSIMTSFLLLKFNYTVIKLVNWWNALNEILLDFGNLEYEI